MRFCSGIAYGTTHPTLQSWGVSQVSPEKKGTANAMLLTGMDLGMAFGAPFLGLVASSFGYQVMFASTSMLILLILVLYTIYSMQKKKISGLSSEEDKRFSSEI